MKYSLIFLLGLFGCVHTSPEVEKKLNQLDEKATYVFYELQNDKCFWTKDICYLNAYNRCTEFAGKCILENGEEAAESCAYKAGICIKQTKKQCWITHEKCIINTHKMWKKYKENRDKNKQ